MAKTITFTYEDKDYTLEYTRRSVREMEREGFNMNDLQSKPMTTIPQLFAGAFKAHHKYMKADDIERIYALFGNKEMLFEKLSDMYIDTLSSLFDDGEEGKNVEWKASF